MTYPHDQIERIVNALDTQTEALSLMLAPDEDERRYGLGIFTETQVQIRGAAWEISMYVASIERADASQPEPLQPIDKPTRKPRSIDVSCPTCKVAAGRPCVMMTRRGAGADPTGEPKTGYHITRTRKAREQHG